MPKGLRIGGLLNHYRIDSKIGEGGMGVVYRAQDTKIGRDVAIKVLPGDFMVCGWLNPVKGMRQSRCSTT